MSSLAGANLALRFVLELSALAAVAYWGWQAADGATRLALAIGAPLVVAVVWGLFVSPKARIAVAKPLRFAIELAVFAAAAAALGAAGHATLGLLFALVALASGAINYRSGEAAVSSVDRRRRS